MNPKYITKHQAGVLMAALWIFLRGICVEAQPLMSPGQSGQFNRIGYTVEIAQAYSPTAAAGLGGEAACQVDMLNACAGANTVQQNSGTGVYWHIIGYYMSTNDPGNVDGSTTLSWLSGNAAAQDIRDFASSIGADLLDYVATDNNVSGIAYQPGYYSTLAYSSGAWYVVFAHELGHNFGCSHSDGLGNGFRTIMLHNYCSGNDISYYSNPDIYYNGIQLLGSVAGNCGTGNLVNNGNNAGIVTLAAPGKQNTGTRPASTNTANAVFHWTFTNAPGVIAAGTTLPDQFGKPLTVRGNGAVFTGTGLRLPGGTNGNVAASSIAAYLDLTNGTISTLTNLTLEIWASPLSGKIFQRLFSFGRMSGAGDGLGASGEWTGTPGTAAPGVTTAVSELGLALTDGSGSLATESLNTVTNSVSTGNLTIGVSTAAGTRHYYAMTFQDGVGTYGTNGGRITCYRDDDGNPTAYLDVQFHLRNLNDVNNWLGRSQYSANAMANVEYAEVRISNVALTPAQIYGNYLLGGGNAQTFFNPVLTAVVCGGAAAGSQSADQRTFAADQSYSGGTAWNNGYLTLIDVSGVTNPAPQTVYQQQRYGAMTYTFSNYQPGTNYLIRLHFSEPYTTAIGQRKFNVAINGGVALANVDVFASAGAQNKAVIKEVSRPANTNGQIVVSFIPVMGDPEISGIEILQGGMYVPINLAANSSGGQVLLNWSPVAGAANYNVKRATFSGGPYVTLGSSATTNYSDATVTNGTTYYYVVSAVNGGNESFNSLEVSGAPGSYIWSPPVPITTANTTLNQPGTVVGAACFGATSSSITVTLSSGTNIVFKGDGSVATCTGQGTFIGASTNNTGNGSFNAVLNGAEYDNGPHTITLKGLTVGKAYSVQLFAIDNRVPENARTFNYQDPSAASNVSQTASNGANIYIMGSFVASGTSMVIQQNLLNGNAGNFNALVIRALPNPSTNANLANLALNPLPGNFSPAFNSNVLFYAAAQAYGDAPTLTVTNADLTARNQLIYNSVTNALPSGLPSGPLALNPNPAVTNVVQVLVTAQDGLTVRTYTLNLTQLPSQSQPTLAVGVNNGVLSFGWPLDHLGYRLLMQTNNLTVGLSLNTNDWVTVPGTTLTNQISLPMDLTQPAEFYRLLYP